MIRREHTQLFKTIQQYKKLGMPYVLTIQNETLTIKSKFGNYTTQNSTYTIDDINFIKKVKKYIIDQGLFIAYEHEDRKPVIYFRYSKDLRIGNVFENVTNIDLSSAYWETANKMGLLSKAIYKEGLKVPKQVRLAAIGSLAKRVRSFEFDGKKVTKLPDIINENTEFLWDAICTRVAKVLLDTAGLCGKDFIFFWVDGIYVKNSAIAKVERSFANAGYHFKASPLKKIEITEKHIHVYPMKPMEKNGKTRDYKPFPFRGKTLRKKK